MQILEDTGKILVLPVLCTSIVVPVSRPAASYYPTIPTEGGMQPTGNSSYGIAGIWELVTEGLFPVVASGKLETNFRTGSVSTVALW